ncbi:MAG: tetratricopeptide repeat protein [Lentisphaeria bacterium]|nr:tetratricopeptide repeat protein [Lentisphaeria bacterium]
MDDKKNLSQDEEVSAQLFSLKETLCQWYEEHLKEQKAKEKWVQGLIVKTVIILTTGLGVVWSGVEMGAWYLDQLQKREMAERYTIVANEMYEKENNPDVALQMLQNALNLDDSFEIRYQIAYINGMKAVQLLMNLDRPFGKEELDSAHQSLADAKFLIQLDDKRAEGFILESQIYTALKEYDKAERSIKKALEVSRNDSFAQIRYATLLYKQRRFKEALKVIEPVAAQNPDYKWAFLWNGLILDALKKKKEAVAMFEKAIAIDPKFDTAIYNLGCCYLNSRPRQFDKARKCFQRVLQVNPSFKEAYYQLGMSYGFQDRYDVALTYMNKAIELSKDYLTARNWRALVLFEMKRFNEAAEAYSEALMLDPRNDELYVRRAAAKVELKQFESAGNDLNFALELNPQNVEAVMILSNLYLQTNNFDLALAKINTAIAHAQKDKAISADLWSLRAKLFVKQSKLEAAVKDQKKAVECYKTKYTLYYLALYQYRAKQIAEALKTLDECAKTDPRFANALKLKVIILKDRDKAAALKAIDRYLEVRPNDKAVQALKKKLTSAAK